MTRNEAFNPEEIAGLKMTVPHGSIEILQSDDHRFMVLIAGDDRSCESLHLLLDHGLLRISQPWNGFPFLINEPRWLQLTLYIPLEWKGAVSIRTRSGSLLVHDLTGSDISLKTTSGTLKAERLQAISLTARTLSGDMEFSDAECDRCRMIAASGNIRLDAGSVSRCSICHLSGEAAVSLLQPADDFSCRSAGGDLILQSASATADVVLHTLRGRLRTEGVLLAADSPLVRFSSLSGNLYLKNADT